MKKAGRKRGKNKRHKCKERAEVFIFYRKEKFKKIKKQFFNNFTLNIRQFLIHFKNKIIFIIKKKIHKVEYFRN